MSQSSKQLINAAAAEGLLSPQSVTTLGSVDLGAQIQAGLGVSVDDIAASEVVLVTMLIDDSSSIRFGNNTQLVRDGHNLVLEALVKSKQRNSILAHTRYLNGDVLYPYNLIDQAVKMDSSNFNPSGGTPLYDQSIVIAGTVLAKTQEFASSGVAVRTVTVIITDGADSGSRKRAADVKPVITDLLRQENHIVAGMGIADGYTDYRQVFEEMGIDDKWILTPGNSDSEIRRAFQMVSQSAVRASQSAANFSQAAAGGFGAP
jgi:hypothetical protein